MATMADKEEDEELQLTAEINNDEHRMEAGLKRVEQEIADLETIQHINYGGDKTGNLKTQKILLRGSSCCFGIYTIILIMVLTIVLILAIVLNGYLWMDIELDNLYYLCAFVCGLVGIFIFLGNCTIWIMIQCYMNRKTKKFGSILVEDDDML